MRRWGLLLAQPIDHPEDRLQQRPPLVPVFFHLGDDRFGPEGVFLLALPHRNPFLLPEGIRLSPLLLQLRGERFLFRRHLFMLRNGAFLLRDGVPMLGGGFLLLDPHRFERLLVLCSRRLHIRTRRFGPGHRFCDQAVSALGAGGAFGDYCRRFLPGHGTDSARGDHTRRAQNGENLQPVSVASVTFTFEPVDRGDPEVQALYADFVREADGPLVYDREEAGIDLDAEIAAGPPTDLVPPNGVLLLVRADGEPAGLGGIRHLDTEIAEVKSMYVAPPFRGTGLGRRILARLDEIALEHDCRAVRLDTSDYLTPAVGLYRSAGYREVPAYNQNPKADLWFERPLRQDA